MMPPCEWPVMIGLPTVGLHVEIVRRKGINASVA